MLKTKRLIALLLAAGAHIEEVSAPYLERAQQLADKIGPDFAAYAARNGDCSVKNSNMDAAE